jgi:bacillithiol synthase
MFDKTTLKYGDTGVLNALVSRYLQGAPELSALYNQFPDKKGFKAILNEPPYQTLDRSVLVDVLQSQSSQVKNTSAATLSNIAQLSGKKCFTVTTGHQLCLFTGPLYFIYKIISTINLAEQLKKEFSEFDFVPVYWMASEDHDFEEVNHFYVSGKKIEWSASAQGAVGDLETAGLKDVMDEFREALGNHPYAAELLALFENSYLKHKTLRDATHFLVNELFGKYGLVVADGNDKELKKLFKEQFINDIFYSKPYESVKKTIDTLSKHGYHAQVNPREINCFYIDNNLRSRIEKKDTSYVVVGTEIKWTGEQLKKMISEEPWKLSPNVTLRPVYQQTILPNIAYVGGPGELAYWLEYKKMFDELSVFFPLLVPRNFITIIDRQAHAKMHKLGFEVRDFYKEEQSLEKELLVRNNNIFEISDEVKASEQLYQKLGSRLGAADQTLAASAAAELQKTIKGLENLAAKANRSLKQRSETEMNQLRNIRQKFFPHGSPQERLENFSSLYLKYGKDFIGAVKDASDPFEFAHIQLIEKS